MSEEETSRKGKEMAFDDDDGGDDFMQEVVERIRPFIFLNCDPRFASTSGRGGLAALTGQESGVKNKKDNQMEKTCQRGKTRHFCKKCLNAGFEQQGVYSEVDSRAMDHYLSGDFEQQGVYRVVDSRAMDHYLSSSLTVVDLGLVVHEQHVPDEGDFAVSQRSVGEWLQEYLHVNYGLISHAVEDRVFTQVRGMCYYELMSHAMEDRVVTQVRGMCYCLAQRLHRSVGGLQFYIHRDNGLGKVIVDTLISIDGGFDHITSGGRERGGSLEEIKTSLPERLLTGFMSQPAKTHWQAGFRLLRYLEATPDRGMFDAAGRTEDEEVYLRERTDSVWARDVDGSRSTTGYCFTLGSGAGSWSSKEQSRVALSSTEAEYGAACADTCEVVWLRRKTEDSVADLFTKAIQQAVVRTHSRSLRLVPHPGSERGC